MAYRRATRAISTDMNITNLVDVVFALLIIFMLTAPLMTQGVKVDLPQTDAKNIDVLEALDVSVNRKREIFIKERKVSLFEFEKEFRDQFKGPQTPVVLNADRHVPYGFVVEIINLLQKIGVEKLSFLTELPSKENVRE